MADTGVALHRDRAGALSTCHASGAAERKPRLEDGFAGDDCLAGHAPQGQVGVRTMHSGFLDSSDGTAG